MITSLPLISCICVTRHKKERLQQAIACFEAQSYENKQIIILYEDDDEITDSFVSCLPDKPNYKIIKVKAFPKLTLGDLRNQAINRADGNFICQWDDDDWYHINRLKYQYEAIVNSGKAGSILKRWLVLDSTLNKLYVSHSRHWEGSLLCSKSLFISNNYDSISRGEDTSLVERLVEQEHLTVIESVTPMYVYVYHGNNTWDSDHFNAIFNRCKLIDIDPVLCKGIFNQSPLKAARLLDCIMLDTELIKQDTLTLLSS